MSGLHIKQSDHPAAAGRHGLTLIEVVASTLLIATVMLVSISASANLLRNSIQRGNAIEGHDLAREMLDEITAMEFQDPDGGTHFGLEGDETATDRMTYDDVDDYQNYVSNRPSRRDGAAIASYAGWSLNVSVQPANPIAAGVAITANARSPLRLITVVCTAPDGSQARESMLVSNVPTDIPARTSHQRWRKTTLTFPEQREISVTAPLRNLPPATP